MFSMLQANASQCFKRLTLLEKPQTWQITACDNSTLKTILDTPNPFQQEESCLPDVTHRRRLLPHRLQLMGPGKDRTKEILPESKSEQPAWLRSSPYLQVTDTLLFLSYMSWTKDHFMLFPFSFLPNASLP